MTGTQESDGLQVARTDPSNGDTICVQCDLLFPHDWYGDR